MFHQSPSRTPGVSTPSPSDMALTAAEKQRRYREKRKVDPQREAAYREKERERDRKKPRIAQLSSEKQERRRAEWRNWKRNTRDRAESLAHVTNNTPPASPTLDIPPSGNQRRGRRTILRNRSMAVRENKKLIKTNDILKSKLEMAVKKADMYRKRYERLLANKPTPSCSNVTDLISPRKEAHEMLKVHCKDNAVYESLKKSPVGQNLVIHSTLVRELSNVYEDKKKRKTIGPILVSKLLKKYRLCSAASIRVLGLKRSKRMVIDHVKKLKLYKFLVNEFFLSDDVSRATAGIKETVTRNKIKKQKRFLLGSLKQLYKKFLEKCGIQISYAVFCRNRPFYVVQPTEKDLESCLCKQHANMKYICDKMKMIGLITTSNSHALVERIVCNKDNPHCMYDECEKCKGKDLFVDTQAVKKTFSDLVKWAQWGAVVKSFKKTDDGKTVIKNVRTVEKQSCEGTINELIACFNNQVVKFKRHIFNVKSQLKAYKACKTSLGSNAALVHIDFSENWNCKYFEEIQSMHFGASRKQVTLHTGVLYFHNQEPLSFATVSDSLDHGPHAVWAHLHPILSLIRQKMPNIKIIHFFSDGPSTQYKQKKNFYLFQQRLFNYGFSFGTWNFFESSHGKGAADGVRGALKRAANSFVAQGNDIPDADTFFKVLKVKTSIQLFFVPATEVKSIADLIPRDLFAVPRCQIIHQITPDKDFGSIQYRELSCFCEKNDFLNKKLCNCQFTPRCSKLLKRLSQARVNAPLAQDSESEETNSDYSERNDSDTILSETEEVEPPQLDTDFDLNQLKPSTYIMVKYKGGLRNKSVFKYAGVCQSCPDDGEVEVMFLRYVGESGTLFLMKEDDVDSVPLENILGVLPPPRLKIVGTRLYYKFPCEVPVYESGGPRV